MPRAPRLIVPGFVYHLISRFVDREWFITHERERRYYVSLLGRAISKSDWRCIGYAVMSNHVHISAVAGVHSLDSWIRRVHSPFADFMNKQHGRIGPLFVRGPRAFETPASDVARLVAYIHNNPVRANVVANPADTRWTSHRAYLGLDPAPSWLDVRLGLRLCGFDKPDAFAEFVALNPSDRARESLESGSVELDESALFREAIAEAPRRANESPSARSVVEATALELQIPISSFCSRRRTATERLAREVAVHCASTVGISGVEIAHALRLSQPSASRALQRAVTRPDVIELSVNVQQRLRERATHTSNV
ncbi:MAG TPA: hypothetical protein VFV99_32200 [Kofleriaceae bacterium]|nr:hypothetical protein [Kofleriaceae bacterium]